MVNDAHLVGLCVAHTQPSFVYRMMVVAAHLPVHTGLRFSRNDEMPSRKSSVSRMLALDRTASWICASISSRAWSVSSFLVAKREAGLFSINIEAKAREGVRGW